MTKINPASTFMTDYDWSKVQNPITDEQLDTWLAALRSGNYQQGDGALKIEVEDIYGEDTGECRFCCLGVLQEVSPIQGVIDDSYLGGKYIPDAPVGTSMGERYSTIYGLPYDIQDVLAGMNDIGDSFTSIADFIEKGFTVAK